MRRLSQWFTHFATIASEATGHWSAFLIATALVVGWALSGPLFGFSDTWQLMINTTTTISTGLIVFLVQHTQNRDTKAMHAKLDELILSLEGPRDELAGIERRADDS
jgi:low affinity Fe/Cu permease